MHNISAPLNINLFAGPGCGKSTIAAQLFATLKMKHKNAELITEFAKDLTYKKDLMTLSDQLYLAGKQHNKLHRLLTHNLDFIIHDSPFVMGLTYVNENGHLPVPEFTDMLVKLYNSYTNLNIFLERNENVDYQQVGRHQTLLQAIDKDNEIKQLLITHKIPFIIVKVGETTIDNILDILHIK
jgi:hypothetical protein